MEMTLTERRKKLAASIEPDAYSIDEFCARNRISVAFVYKLWSGGKGPRFMRIGGRRLISREAAEDWRRAQEVAA